MSDIVITVRFGMIARLGGNPVVFVEKLKQELVFRKYVENDNQVEIKDYPFLDGSVVDCVENILCSYQCNTSICKVLEKELKNIIAMSFDKSTN